MLSYIREKGYSDVTHIDYAIIEPSGEISVLPKQEAAPVTPKQLKIDTADQGLPITVILEGKIQHDNLKIINKDEKWLKKELTQAGYSDQSNIFYVAIREHDYLLTTDTGEGGFKNS